MKISKKYDEISRDLDMTISEVQSGNFILAYNTLFLFIEYINELLGADRQVSSGAKESYKIDFCHSIEFLRTNGSSHLINKTNTIKVLKHIKSLHLGYKEPSFDLWNHNTISDAFMSFFQNFKFWKFKIKWLGFGLLAIFFAYSGQITNAFDFFSFIK